MDYDYLLDETGAPFHMKGTEIYWTSDDTLHFRCPHCGDRPVPAPMMNAMLKYAPSQR